MPNTIKKHGVSSSTHCPFIHSKKALNVYTNFEQLICFVKFLKKEYFDIGIKVSSYIDTGVTFNKKPKRENRLQGMYL